MTKDSNPPYHPRNSYSRAIICWENLLRDTETKLRNNKNGEEFSS